MVNTTINSKVTLLLFIAMIGFALASTGNVFAQNSASDNASVSAYIVTPISITNAAALQFGQVAAGVTTGTVSVSTGGVRTAGGGTKLGTGSGQAASFTVNGEPNYQYNIQLPSSITLDDTHSHTMTVDNFVSSPSGTGTLSSGGSSTLSVGARLNVGASQTSGTYSGTFSVTVAYP
jgi:hypothetical protein